jgi:IS4 transposase
MRSQTHHSVSARQVESLAGGILHQALQLVDHGPKCTVRTLLLILFFAASRAGSIFDACRRLRNAPCDQAVRNALLAQLPPMTQLEQRLNQALQSKLPKSLNKKRRRMAIDLNEICYYGQPQRHEQELRRGKRKAGTSRFHCYATLYVVHRGQRFTVAVTYVWKNDSLVAVVQRLLEQAQQIGLRPRYLLLDRAFYGLEVVRYLKSVRCPWLMPVVHRGRRSKRPLSQLKGTRRFLAWNKSGFSTHVMSNRRQQTTVSIAVACRRKRRRGQGRRGRSQGDRRRSQGDRRQSRPMVFAFWGFRPASPAWVRQAYRMRFGIETSYRQMNQGRVRTCSRDPRLRLLLVGIALVLRNVWVWLHYAVLGRVRGRGIELHLELLHLRTMLLMLQRCAEQAMGCTETVVQEPTGSGVAIPSRL